MTMYNNLPIYKVTYDLFLEVFRIVGHFSREYKFTLGQDLKDETTKLLKRIFQANSNLDSRKKYIIKARSNVEIIRLYIRLLKDLIQINLEKFVFLNGKIESISKQLLAWQKVS